MLNDLKPISLNNKVQCKKDHDSEVVLVDNDSNICTNNKVHCEKNHDTEVVLVHHELSICMMDTWQCDRDVHINMKV